MSAKAGSPKLNKKAEAQLTAEAERLVKELLDPIKRECWAVRYTEDMVAPLTAEVKQLERIQSELHKQRLALWQAGKSSSPLSSKMLSAFYVEEGLNCRDFTYESTRALSKGMQKLKLLMDIAFSRVDIADLMEEH